MTKVSVSTATSASTGTTGASDTRSCPVSECAPFPVADSAKHYGSTSLGLEEFSMSWLFLDKVWKPDTYFINGKKSFLHRITVPNKFLRLRYDGYITYSMRLTITASCPMYLRKFPLDAQRCPLIIGSCEYLQFSISRSRDAPISRFRSFQMVTRIRTWCTSGLAEKLSDSSPASKSRSSTS